MEIKLLPIKYWFKEHKANKIFVILYVSAFLICGIWHWAAWVALGTFLLMIFIGYLLEKFSSGEDDDRGSF